MSAPSQDVMNRYIGLLQAVLNPGEGHQQALQSMDAAKSDPAFFETMAYFMSQIQDPAYLSLRRIAGSQIKNNLHLGAAVGTPNVMQYTMQAVGDADDGVRRTASSIVCEAVTRSVWDLGQVVSFLTSGLTQGAQSPNLASGCIVTLDHLVEQHYELLDATQQTTTLVPAIAGFLDSTDQKIQKKAMSTMATLLEQAAINPGGAAFRAAAQIIGVLIGKIGTAMVTPNQNVTILKEAIKCLYFSFCFQDAMAPHFAALSTMMIDTFPKHTDEFVRLEVVEFWRAVLRFPNFAEQALVHMEKVITFLLDSLTYSSMELGMMGAADNDWNVPDKPEDVKPRNFQRNKAGDIAEDDEEDEDGDVEQWNLRRAAATALDEVSLHFGDRILQGTLGLIDARMKPENPWQVQEAGILGIAAIAEGCFEGVKPYLPMLIKQLCSLAEAETTNFLVRATAIYTLSRYAEWVLDYDESKAEQLDARCINCILSRGMVSPSKKVQEMATGSLAEFATVADNGQLEPFAASICQTIGQCLDAYQMKNRYVLFETLDECCGALGKRMADDDALGAIMNPLMKHWEATPDNSPLVFPYFECMATVSAAIGGAMQAVAPQVFQRAMTLGSAHLIARYQAAQAQQEPPDESEDFAVASLDLVSGLTEALGSSIEPCITAVGVEHFMNVLCAATVDTNPQVRQSAFGLFGELSNSCVMFIQTYLALVYPQLKAGLGDSCHAVVSNTAWGISNLAWNQIEAENAPALASQHVDELLQLLLTILSQEHDVEQRNMCDNVCVAIGCLLKVDSTATQRPPGNSIGSWIGPWCKHVRNMKNVSSKDNALQGILPQLAQMPQILAPVSDLFFDVLTSLPKSMNHDIRQQATTILQALKAGLGAQWAQYLAKYNPSQKKKLLELYRI